MANSTSAGPGSAAVARHAAQRILAEARFHSAAVPRPLHGLLRDIGNLIKSPLGAVEELVSSLGSVTPGGATVVWGALAAVILLASGLLAVRGARRALDAPAAAGTSGEQKRAPSAGQLEREALAAERAGRNSDAVRFRFRAGLMRLAEKQRLAGAGSMLNAEVSRALRSQRFDGLARSFDEVAYGGRVADSQDVEISRREWSRLLGSERER